MSLGWDLGTRTTRIYLLPHVPSSAGWWHVVAPSPSTGRRSVWHSCQGPGQRRAEAIVWRQSTRPSIAVWNCPVHLPTQPSLCRWRCYRPRTPWSRSSRSWPAPISHLFCLVHLSARSGSTPVSGAASLEGPASAASPPPATASSAAGTGVWAWTASGASLSGANHALGQSSIDDLWKG